MNNGDVVRIISNCNGHFTHISWESPQDRKMSADAKRRGVQLTKRVTMTASADIKYENTKEYDKHSHDLPSWQERVSFAAMVVRDMTNNHYMVQALDGTTYTITSPKSLRCGNKVFIAVIDGVPMISCDGLVRHKTTGKLYLQVYPSHAKNQMTSQFYLNGQPITKEEAWTYIIPSQRMGKESDLISVALDTIIDIG